MPRYEQRLWLVVSADDREQAKELIERGVRVAEREGLREVTASSDELGVGEYETPTLATEGEPEIVE
jgi:hypothetical protein